MFKSFETYTTALPNSKYAKNLFGSFEEQIKDFENMFSSVKRPSYPPYNLLKVTEDNKTYYTIQMALAGFTADDINVEIVEENNKRFIEVSCDDPWSVSNVTYEFVHQGIAARKFKWSAEIKGNGQITETTLDNGILNIRIDFPEPKEPKRKTFKVKQK